MKLLGIGFLSLLTCSLVALKSAQAEYQDVVRQVVSQIAELQTEPSVLQAELQEAPPPQGIAACQVPQLYKNPMYDSPTRANPGDPLLIPGSNFARNAAVVYQ